MSTTHKPLIIIATAGTGGDIYPFIAVAQVLQQRGHQVQLVVPAFQEPLVQRHDIPYQTIGSIEQGHQLLNNPDAWNAHKGWQVIWSGLKPHLNALKDIVQALPATTEAVVLCHSMLSPVAALARSVRPQLHIVSAILAPSNLCSSYDMLTAGPIPIPAWIPLFWRQTIWRGIHKIWTDPTSLADLNAARAKHHLSAVPSFIAHMLSSPNATVGFFPSWFAAPQPDWPHPFYTCDFVNVAEATKQSPWPADLERFLSNGEKPIVFTPGTGHQHAAHYFQVAAQVIEQLGRRGLFITPYAEQLPASLPANIMWQPQAPFTALLPRAAAIVHHGGIGTTAQAFHAGIPQLIVPFAYDQFDNGLRAQRLGCAKVLKASDLSVKRMLSQLTTLLESPEIKKRCAEISAKTTPLDLNKLVMQVETALFPH